MAGPRALELVERCACLMFGENLTHRQERKPVSGVRIAGGAHHGALRAGVAAVLITVGVTGLLVGLIGLATRRVRRRRTDAEQECDGLRSFTWNDSE